MKDTTKNTYRERMLTVLLHIQSNLDNELSLDSLAALTHFSPIHFHRIFKGMMGETVIEHIRRIRLERAALQLVCNQSSVTNAAFDAGYETVEAFSRVFKKMFGCPPSKYRETRWAVMLEQLPGTIHYLPENARIGLNILPTGEREMDVRIEEVAPEKVAFVRHTGPYEKCETAWDTLCSWAFPKGLCNMQTKFIGVCYDDPQVTPPDKVRYDACIPVPDQVSGEGPVGVQTLEGGHYAIVTHKGPYSKLEKTYAQLMGQWLPQNSYELRDTTPGFEVYLNDPQTTPPEELLTDIFIPLK
ncbi:MULTISPECIES: AraC family transcriptional regulator [unclassified Pseudodesulfovibrio]|uniref:AraC family transcriptional regulator n=1 Tax=unclassified Pseudodesulfovibrio TaxID=2661612 RepID=UPI000FEB8DF1|nr:MULTISPECIES: AraC family transcriptional regulator [unclassified Pseudodesulfovibrio]MCJ2163312.1 AraC family transcriptional regulator [Pseudodesulfovibrio sp. S3-i]RWU07291.1 AraC family transcriptional regulator [Pseudodesulfovibrio sp. S3]